MPNTSASQKRGRKNGKFPGAIVHENVPPEVRSEIDEALTTRAGEHISLAGMHNTFRLKDRFGVGITAFRAYAKLLRNRKRKESAGRIATSLCPVNEVSDEDTLQRRGHLLIVQQIVRSLEESELSTADLCSLARAFSTQRKLSLDVRKFDAAPPTGTDRQRRFGLASDENNQTVSREQIAGLVREIYGLDVPYGPNNKGPESIGAADSPQIQSQEPKPGAPSEDSSPRPVLP